MIWIWPATFPGALQIVDLYHARQHLWDLTKLHQPTLTQTLDEGQPKTLELRQGKNRKLVCRFVPSFPPTRKFSKDSPASRLLETNAAPCATGLPPALVCRRGV